MATQIFVNLPVKDLNKSKAFFEALGYSFNPQFTNEMGGALVIGDNIFYMLLTEDFFKTFTKKELADRDKTISAINCLSAESRERVDEIYDLAIANGASPAQDATDYGWMYGRSFLDLDGHHWEFAYMDPAGPPAE
ncbi:VOC family protein [Mucilaginibacter myungsuensis]|uniref:VOC family protein n=1 Tax=Mucilaginibacter myungsuensis TaxID=649104 RepID=A0A929KVW0_9SPHI|nr:VOC family protein [Mucilaginibacter myungsuensis]MBE9662561.1 VOC family protein [Mucilaginibacter myungsuensis]MDN3597981.1 VOC family protein [Mucilaginibacter myungsuensis]